MTNNVCIVLNEREPHKLEVADKLQSALSVIGINLSRLKIGPDINEECVKIEPGYLILDYLLGDYSTGLDV